MIGRIHQRGHVAIVHYVGAPAKPPVSTPPSRKNAAEVLRASQGTRRGPASLNPGMDASLRDGRLLLEEDEAALLHSGTVNGIHMEWADTATTAEERELPAVLFLHGWPESWYSWRSEIDS